MHPYLFDWVIAGHHISPPTYGVLLAISFSLGYFISIRRTIQLGEDPRHDENIFLFVVSASIVGSRLFHVLFEEFPYYRAHPLKIFAVWEGGYTFYGAVVASLLVISFYCRRHRLSFLQWGDIAAPSVALGLALGRVGCFAAGCCWGRPTHVPWAVTFRDPNSFTTLRNIPLHPTQLYESFAGLVIFLYLTWRFRNRQYPGQILFHGLAIYSVARFIIEFYRGDDYRGYILGGAISYSQLVSLLILPLAVAGIAYAKRVKRLKPDPDLA